MTGVIVIPARYGSTRFPGKPLALIAGKSLLERTWSIAKQVKHIDEVYVSTDDQRIKAHVEGFGGQVVMTRADCQNGTERAFDTVSKLEERPEIIINLQGDAVLTPPWVIQALVDRMIADPSIELATPATRLSRQQYEQIAKLKANGQLAGTMVAFDLQYNALYFSRSIIPHIRESASGEPPVYRHVGLYGYRYPMLESYLSLKPTPLESVEKLEQLRALEHGIAIKIVLVDYHGRTHWSVDSPEDVTIVEQILSKEGELV